MIKHGRARHRRSIAETAEGVTKPHWHRLAAKEKITANLPRRSLAGGEKGRQIRKKELLTKYVTDVTVTSLTVIEVTTAFSSTFALQSSAEDRAGARREAEKEFLAMSEAMIAEKG